MEFNELIKEIKDFSNQNTEYKKLFFSNAIAGEVGEFCNLVKKLHRDYYKDKIYGFKKDEIKEYIDLMNNIKLELADIFIYLVLNAKQYNIDLEIAIQDKLYILNKRIGINNNGK